jgi:hypothetical protein
MNTYIVTLNNVEVGRYNSDAPVEWTGWEFATHDHVALPVEPIPVVVPVVYEWLPFTFLRKFTQAERIAIRETRNTDPVLHDFFCLVEQAVNPLQSVDPDMKLGMGYLVQLGLITEARMTEFLSTP